MFRKIQQTIYKVANFLATTGRNVKSIFNPKMGVMGVSGTDFSGQYITDEYLSNLQDLYTRCNFYDVMEKSEPAIRLALLTYKKPLISANKDIVIDEKLCEREGISEEMQEKMIQCVRYNLYERNKKRLKKQYNEILQFKKYGFSIMEIIWAVEDGMLVLDDLQFRHPRTILWQIDKNNKLLGVKQTNYYGNKTPEPIPIDKMLLFSQEDIGDNYEGISDLRYMYRPYLEKDKLKRIVMVALQKFGVGMPIVTMPNNSNPDDKAQIEEFIKHWNSYDQLGGILPYGWDKEILEGNFTGASLAMQFQDKLNAEIFMAAMAIFVLPTLKGSGSLALSKDASDFFGMALQADADIMDDTVNYELIPRLIDKNFQTTVYPYQKTTIREQDTQQLIDNIRGCVKDGVLPVCEQLQERVGALLELEDINWSDIAEQDRVEQEAEKQQALELAKAQKPEEKPIEENKPEEELSGDEIEEKSECGCGCTKTLQEGNHWRELTEHEENAGGIETMAERQNFFKIEQKNFEKAVKPILDKQSAAVLKYSKNHSAYEVMTFEVPDKAKYQKILQGFYEKAVIQGLNTMAKQAKKEIPAEAITQVKRIAKERSQVLAERAASDLTFQVAAKMMDQKAQTEPKPIDEKVEKQEYLTRAYSRFLDAFGKGL